jgi:hypothetical protein
MAYENVSSPVNFQRQVLGQKGLRTIRTGGAGTSGEFYRAITVLADAVISTTAEAGDNLSSAAIPAGVTVYGLFSSVSVTSGEVLAYIA